MTNRKNCESFLASLNEALDVRAPLPMNDHVAVCVDCQNQLAYATALHKAPTTPIPAGLVEATMRRIADDQRVHRRQRIRTRVGGFALAASVLLAVWGLWPQPEQPVEIAQPQGVVKPLAEARDAIVSLSAKVADDSIAPAKSLITANPRQPQTLVQTNPTSNLPEAASAGFAPLVSTPRKALNLFIHDLGGAVSRGTMN